MPDRTATHNLSSAATIRNLSVLAYANKFTLWHYQTAKVRDAIAPGHFEPMRDILTVGDQMHVQADDGAAVLYVRSVTDATVTVAWLSLAEHPTGTEG